MESLNQTLFFWLNAPEHPGTRGHLLCRAVHLGNSAPDWLRGSEKTCKVMLVATASGLLGLLVNQFMLASDIHRRFFGKLIARGWVRE